jgi:hypothetical protein
MEKNNLQQKTMSTTAKRDHFKSVFKGVNFNKRSKLWDSSITVNGKRNYFVDNETERKAAIARDKFILTKKLDKPTQVLTKTIDK